MAKRGSTLVLGQEAADLPVQAPGEVRDGAQPGRAKHGASGSPSGRHQDGRRVGDR